MKKKQKQELDIIAQQLSDLVPEEKRNDNARYVVHTMRLSSLPSIDINSAMQIRERTFEYLKYCGDDGMKPNIVGYALSLGMNRHGLESVFTNRLAKGQALNEIERGIAMIENITVELMLDFKINPATAIFTLKNHFGYTDQNEVTIRSERLEQASAQEIQKKYDSILDISGGDDDETVG